MRSLTAFLLVSLLATAHSWELPEFMKEYAAKQHVDTNNDSLRNNDNDNNDNDYNKIVPFPINLKTLPDTRALNDFTESPTESPAPSPSPSWAPTGAPTRTKAPTGKPTIAPTESPAPSPSPSWAPTFGPTNRPTMSPSSEPTMTPSQPPSNAPTKTPQPTTSPSQYPSALPSQYPTAEPSFVPTTSLMPSSQPSFSPSDVPSQLPTTSEPSAMPSTSEPSQAPSASMVPSVSPSVVPTISLIPSAMPSHSSVEEASFLVVLALENKLNATQIEAFEKGTATWLEETDAVDSGRLTNVVVEVDDQTTIETEIPFQGRRQRRRSLQGGPPTSIRKDLALSYTVSATYIGTDPAFNFTAELDPEFQEQNTLWLREIENEDPVFAVLNPVVSGVEDIEDQKRTASKGGGSGNMTMVLVLVVAIAAISLGVAASVYSVRSHHTAQYGEELASPTHSGLAARSMDDDHTQPSKTFDVSATDPTQVQQQQEAEAIELAIQAKGCTNNNNMYGCNPAETLVASLPHHHRGGPEMQQQQQQFMNAGRSSGATVDPPSAASDVGVGGTQQRPAAAADPSQQGAYTSHAPAPLEPQSLVDSRSNYRKTAIFDEAQTPSELSFTTAGYTQESGRQDPYNQAGMEASRELQLTRTMGGTLGAAAVNGSPQAPSDFSSQANSFFANFMGRNRANRDSGGTLGARRLGNEKQRDSSSSYDMLSRRAGLYDVFAPAGPIGIVVDTTKDGPAVHSLKPTSPMLGLMNPGDLIVGLDDVDTRNMTAATLTRLMAKKANQKERKITLLAADSY